MSTRSKTYNRRSTPGRSKCLTWTPFPIHFLDVGGPGLREWNFWREVPDCAVVQCILTWPWRTAKMIDSDSIFDQGMFTHRILKQIENEHPAKQSAKNCLRTSRYSIYSCTDKGKSPYLLLIFIFKVRQIDLSLHNVEQFCGKSRWLSRWLRVNPCFNNEVLCSFLRPWAQYTVRQLLNLDGVIGNQVTHLNGLFELVQARLQYTHSPWTMSTHPSMILGDPLRWSTLILCKLTGPTRG